MIDFELKSVKLLSEVDFANYLHLARSRSSERVVRPDFERNNIGPSVSITWNPDLNFLENLTWISPFWYHFIPMGSDALTMVF